VVLLIVPISKISPLEITAPDLTSAIAASTLFVGVVFLALKRIGIKAERSATAS
jgi:hypothetical protein